MAGQWIEKYKNKTRPVDPSDPDELDYFSSPGSHCSAKDPYGAFVCTRTPGHSGKHVAGAKIAGAIQFICSWIDSCAAAPQAPPPPAVQAPSVSWKLKPQYVGPNRGIAPYAWSQICADNDLVAALHEYSAVTAAIQTSCCLSWSPLDAGVCWPCSRVLGHSGDHVRVWPAANPDKIVCSWTEGQSQVAGAQPQPTVPSFPALDPKKLVSVQPMTMPPKVQPNCECGAHKLGVKDYMAGHSDWCRASVEMSGKRLQDVKF